MSTIKPGQAPIEFLPIGEGQPIGEVLVCTPLGLKEAWCENGMFVDPDIDDCLDAVQGWAPLPFVASEGRDPDELIEDMDLADAIDDLREIERGQAPDVDVEYVNAGLVVLRVVPMWRRYDGRDVLSRLAAKWVLTPLGERVLRVLEGTSDE